MPRSWLRWAGAGRKRGGARGRTREFAARPVGGNKKPRFLARTAAPGATRRAPDWEREAAGYLLRRGRRGQKQAKVREFMGESCTAAAPAVKRRAVRRAAGARCATYSDAAWRYMSAMVAETYPIA